MNQFDLIGDIHGQSDKLKELLSRLGYRPQSGSWRHAEGRRVVFLGDYIDRGPGVREALQIVRGMAEAGDALAIMGNHEYNAICYATSDGAGGWLRDHGDKNTNQLAETLAQFADREAEWAQWLGWFKQLPLALDLGGIRAVHACWDARRFKLVNGRKLTDEAFLRVAAKKRTPEHRAVENLLKGPELSLPEGCFVMDKGGVPRRSIRVRWWALEETMTIGELAMPPGSLVDGRSPEAWRIRNLPGYDSGEKPVFFGHYWLAPDAAKAPLAVNVACLDFSAASGGPLVAYRWEGEKELRESGFISVG